MYYYRSEADYTRQINVYELLRDGFLKRDISSGYGWVYQGKIMNRLRIKSFLSNVPHLLLQYDGFKLRFPNIDLTTTACRFGGKRYWFVCPMCRKRVGVIYFRSEYNACRECSYLTYETRKLSGKWKWAGKIVSVEEVKSALNRAKRKYHKGLITRKYTRYRRLQLKFLIVYYRNISHLQAGINYTEGGLRSESNIYT